MTTLWQMFRFGLVGGLATIVHIAVVVFLSLSSAFPPLAINTIAFCVAFIVSGLGHSFFTFRVKENRLKSIMRFFIIALGALALSNFVLWAVLPVINVNIAKAIAIIIVPLVSYLAAKFWAFREA